MKFYFPEIIFTEKLYRKILLLFFKVLNWCTKYGFFCLFI